MQPTEDAEMRRFAGGQEVSGTGGRGHYFLAE
jgi:hypothetical protein